MNVEVIIASHITWPKTSKEDRTHDKDFMKKLALSIETDGLLQPIGVRPDPNNPGCYLGVFGRHRAGATTDILKRDQIAAHVFLDMDDEEAEIATVVENLFRNPLSKTQQAKAIATWHDQYDKKRAAYADAKKVNAAAEKKATPKKARATQVQSGPEEVEAIDPVAVEPLPPEPPKNFAAHVATVTGESETTVKRALKIGKAFTPSQLEVIEQQGVNQTWQDTIASLPAPKRDAVINLIASGMDEKDAISKVEGTPEVTRADGKTYEVAPTAPGEKAEADMTDDEWVRFHCAETIALLEDPSVFMLHAILYRATRDARQTFKTKSKAILAEAKQAGAYAGAFSIINKFVTMAHPSKWLRCGVCSGTGFAGPGEKCKACSGLAFVVKQEAK